MLIKVSEATNLQIDWLVAKCEGVYLAFPVPLDKGCTPFQPSTDWSQGGPIVEREAISVEHSGKYGWIASQKGPCSIGTTPLIAAMRCFVASKLGDDIEIPEELI